MVAGRDMCTVIDVAYKSLSLEAQCTTKEIACQVYEDELQEIVDNPIGSISIIPNCLAAAPIPGPSQSELDLKKASVENGKVQFVPIIRSGSCTDIGRRRTMEDEHIRIDDLSEHLGPLFEGPTPNAFYGVFDGHGGSDAAVFIRQNLLKFIIEDANLPQFMKKDGNFLSVAETSVRNAFLLADNALADDCSVDNSSGTTVLTALIFGRTLIVANVGDCRAVLSRRGKAVEMSRDHKPDCLSERLRIEALGGVVDDGYLNGDLSVARALGDWDIKMPKGSKSPLSAEPEFREAILTEEDEFLIIGCDGIWDVMSSECAVRIARKELMLHNNPEQCSRELVLEALRRDTCDNLTVVVVCFSADPPPRIERPRLRFCGISSEGLHNLRTYLD